MMCRKRYTIRELYFGVYMPLFYVAEGLFFLLRHRRGQGRPFATRISIESEAALWILGM